MSPDGGTVPGPTPSQTVGPFFRIGLAWMPSPDLVAPGSPGAVTLTGRVLDGDGDAVPDAVVEIWQAATAGFARCLVDPDGGFSFTLGQVAPLDVTIFARGLLNRLVTRVGFAGDPASDDDAVLALVPADRRQTLTASPSAPGRYGWDVRLQGGAETVFLVW